MNVFDPVLYSTNENEFLLAHVGEPPLVALRALPPTGVNVKAVRPVLERIYELSEYEKHSGMEWVGVEAIKEKITAYLTQSDKWAADKRRGAPRFPSLHSFDTKGRPHRYGVGSDAGKVTTYFGPGGQRIPFAVDLIPDGVTGWTPDWAQGTDAPEKGLKVDGDNRRIECQLCGHTEAFNPESRGSFNAARGRISKHLRTYTTDVTLVEAHRELHTNEFGG